MRRLALKIIAVIAILLIVPKVVSSLMGTRNESPSGKAAISNSQAQALASAQIEKLHAELPKTVATGVTLTDVAMIGNVVRYSYRLDASSGFDADHRDQYENNMIAMVCHGSMRELLDHGMQVSFRTTVVDSQTGEAHGREVKRSMLKHFDTIVGADRCG